MDFNTIFTQFFSLFMVSMLTFVVYISFKFKNKLNDGIKVEKSIFNSGNKIDHLEDEVKNLKNETKMIHYEISEIKTLLLKQLK